MGEGRELVVVCARTRFQRRAKMHGLGERQSVCRPTIILGVSAVERFEPTIRAGVSECEMASSSAVRLGMDRTPSFHRLVQEQGPATVEESQRRWEKGRDEAMGPILSDEFVRRCKACEKDGAATGQGLSHRERDGMRLRRADEEWIGEAAKIVRMTLLPLAVVHAHIPRSFTATYRRIDF